MTSCMLLFAVSMVFSMVAAAIVSLVIVRKSYDMHFRHDSDQVRFVLPSLSQQRSSRMCQPFEKLCFSNTLNGRFSFTVMNSPTLLLSTINTVERTGIETRGRVRWLYE